MDGNGDIRIEALAGKQVPSSYRVESRKTPVLELHPYFSFRYYHKNHKKYSLKNFGSKKDVVAFIEALHKLSQETWHSILVDKRDYYHAHEVNWSKTSVKGGFTNLPEKLKKSPVIQFKVFKECRVFGFFNKDSIFKIVWIDRKHEVYKDKKK